MIPAFESSRRTGRDNFFVRVVAKEGSTVELDVYRTVRDPGHGDFDFEKSFGLQLLWIFPNLLDRETYPLARDVPFESMNDLDELAMLSEQIIASIDALESRNYPLDEDALRALSDDDYVRFWNDPANAPFMRFAISVRNPKWIEHLSVGLDYHSPAYSRD